MTEKLLIGTLNLNTNKQIRDADLFVLRLNIPVNNFSVVGTEPMLPGFNQCMYFRELICLAQGHNTMMPVGIEPRTS